METRSVLILYVLAFITVVVNGTDTVDQETEDSQLTRKYPDPYVDEEKAQEKIYIAVGCVSGVLLIIGAIILLCLYCSMCPAYKYRMRRTQGAVIVPANGQQTPVVVVNGYNPNQGLVYGNRPGIVYAQGVPQEMYQNYPPPPAYQNKAEGNVGS